MALLMMSQRLHEKIYGECSRIDLKLTYEGYVYYAKGIIHYRQWSSSSFDISYDANPPAWGNYFDIRKGELSYKVGEQQLTPDGKWAREGRQICKASKLIAYLLEIDHRDPIREIKDHRYDSVDEDFLREVLHLKFQRRYLELLSTIVSSKGSDILISDKPDEIYGKPTSECGCGTLRSSCMRPESDYDCRNHPMFYTDIGAKIAYTLDTRGHLFSRALLWENVIDLTTHKSFKFMDRIYGSEETIEDMKQWARDNGYAYKKEQSYSNSTLIHPDGHQSHNFCYFKVFEDNSVKRYKDFPYVDTLCNCTVANNIFELYS
jgi:hypothetical protein